MKIAVVTQARIGSTRLPNKVLRSISGSTLLEIHLKRARKAVKPTHFFVATTFEEGVSSIIDVAEKCEWNYFQGSLTDVLDRFYNCLKTLRPDYVVRITSDCPLLDPKLIDDVINLALDNDLDYASNAMAPSFPDGQDVEVFKFSALESAHLTCTLPSEREHVTPYIWKNSSFFKGSLFKSDNLFAEKDYKDVRITVDDERDFNVVKLLIEKLGAWEGWQKYADVYLSSSEIHNLNLQTKRNEGYQKSLINDRNHDK